MKLHARQSANPERRQSVDAAGASALELVRPARACGAMNRRGEPCRSRAVLADGFCFAHSSLALASPAEIGRRGGIVSGEVRREQGKSVRERLREKVEAEADEVWRVYRDAFDATGDDGDADHRARLASVEGVLAQAYGRPPQAIVGDADQPVTFVLASLLQRAREEAERAGLGDGGTPAPLADVEVAGELESPRGDG